MSASITQALADGLAALGRHFAAAQTRRRDQLALARYQRDIRSGAYTDRRVPQIKAEVRQYARRRAHELSQDLGLAPRTCREPHDYDGYPGTCDLLLDDTGNCPRHDTSATRRRTRQATP